MECDLLLFLKHYCRKCGKMLEIPSLDHDLCRKCLNKEERKLKR